MSVSHSVAEILSDHVTYELESIDRMYLNLYQPRLQSEKQLVAFFRFHRGHTFASSALMNPMSKQFVSSIYAFADARDIPVISFRKGERKDEVAKKYLRDFKGEEGIVFIGKAQEKTSVFRTERRTSSQTGNSYAWIVRSTAIVNHFYFYGIDKDFGPFFIKFGTYFPYTGKVCINGHEYLKRQLAKRGIEHQALDNSVVSCEDPKRVQRIADSLSAAKIEIFIRRWLRTLPTAFTPADRAAGYRYDISILQAEFSLTQVLDRPTTGRVFFEEVIRENLSIGRPDQVQLIFNRKVTRRTPGRFRTRVITEGVIPSLHIDYKRSKIKQYHKEGVALRTETIINETRDFAIGKRLLNLPALREVGFKANRRLLDVQTVSHDCAIGEDGFRKVVAPVQVGTQRASGLRFGDSRALALLSALVVFRLFAHGFSNRDLRATLAQLLGLDPGSMTQGRMTYDLRRLRLHGLIERSEGTHRYRVTDFGLRSALFLTRTYGQLLRPALSEILDPAASDAGDPKEQTNLRKLNLAIEKLIREENLAA